MLPLGQLIHNIPNRLRIKVESKQGDAVFFNTIEKETQNRFSQLKVQSNPVTGSILIFGIEDVNALKEFFKANNLFELSIPPPAPKSLAQHLMQPIDQINKAAGNFTGGILDLPSAIFLGLLTFGIIELARGNLRMPPWYTAFWYAFGVFSKSIADKALFPDTEGGFLDDE